MRVHASPAALAIGLTWSVLLVPGCAFVAVFSGASVSVVLGVALTALLVVLVRSARSRVVVAGESVQVVNLFRTYRIPIADIVSWEWATVYPGGTPTYGLCCGPKLRTGRVRPAVATFRMGEERAEEVRRRLQLGAQTGSVR